jgi:hypothetical protein
MVGTANLYRSFKGSLTISQFFEGKIHQAQAMFSFLLLEIALRMHLLSFSGRDLFDLLGGCVGKNWGA